MATQRDKIWHTTLDLLATQRSVTVTDIAEAIDHGSPTKRTILDCLTAMESLGVLSSEGGDGRAPRVFFRSGEPTDWQLDTPDSQATGNHLSTFPYPGGKGRQSTWIISQMPAHDTYVEVFGGSGAVLYNKPLSTYEVYNDCNDDLTQFFSILRDREEELAEFLRAVPYSRSLYDGWVTDFYNGVRPDDPVERAGRFFTLRYMQFAGDMSGPTGFKTRAKRSPARTFDHARERIHELADRFRHVIIENRDYRKILEGYDDSDVDVLFYCDPPYLNKEGYYGGDFDHDAFVDALLDVDNEWMVSYSDLPNGLEEFTVIERECRRRMTRGSEATERLVCSFEPRERQPFIDEECT